MVCTPKRRCGDVMSCIHFQNVTRHTSPQPKATNASLQPPSLIILKKSSPPRTNIKSRWNGIALTRNPSAAQLETFFVGVG
mmetsp:Transcript_13334/g.16274  ORF Transcript_13334/g.16274 Transcript_13334/m.16274 type:complete len:81 (+) Transcript_13334:475-717(+)